MNPVLSTLATGPKPYSALRGLLPVYQLDAVLKGLLQAKRIRITTKGFDLPAQTIDDEEWRAPENDEMICIACNETKPIKSFRRYHSGKWDEACNTCRHKRIKRPPKEDGRKRQTCRSCQKDKLPNQFPAAIRGYAKAVCYRCRKHGKPKEGL